MILFVVIKFIHGDSNLVTTNIDNYETKIFALTRPMFLAGVGTTNHSTYGSSFGRCPGQDASRGGRGGSTFRRSIQPVPHKDKGIDKGVGHDGSK